RLSLVAVDVLLVLLQHYEELGAVVVWLEDLALVANQQAPAAGQLRALVLLPALPLAPAVALALVHQQDVLNQLERRAQRRHLLVVGLPVVPPELQRRHPLALRGLVPNPAGLGEGLGAELAGLRALAPLGEARLQGAGRHADRLLR